MRSESFPQWPVWVEVDLGRFKNNIRAIKNHISATCELIIVLKSDAYGHGTVKLAEAANEENLLGRIGVATNEEARWLREAGFDNPIIKLVPSLPDEMQECVRLGIEEIVSDLPTVKRLADIAKQTGRSAFVHFGLDTGMGRKGCLDSEALEQIAEMASVPGIVPVGIMTHFPIADYEDKEFTLKQIESFNKIKVQLEQNGLKLNLSHVANSAALLDLEEAQMDAVRAGLIIYGMYPSEHVKRLKEIKQVMTFKTRVALVRSLPEGRTIGYTCSYKTPSERLIATLPLGYNDGYFRHLSDKAKVLIRGKRARVVGVVSMNLVTVDVTDIPGVKAGDEVVLFGDQGNETISAEEFGAWAGTINYEVTTRIGTRNHKVYIEN